MAKAAIEAAGAATRPARKTPPGPRGNPILGMTLDLARDPLRFVLTVPRRYGDVVRYRFLFHDTYFVNQPDAVKRVLQENHRNYDRQLFDFQVLSNVLGKGLLTSDGEFWLRQRRLMQPAFHRRRIAAFGTLMTGETEAMLARWPAAARSPRPLDVAAEMHRLTLRIVAQALFGTELRAEVAAISRALVIANRRVTQFFFRPFPPLSFPTPENRKFQAAVRDMDAVVDKIIAAHRARNAAGDDLVALLMQARDPDTGEGMDDRQLRDEVLTVLLAGHETTANALTWTFYLLSQHPTVFRRLQAELAATLGGRTPGVADLPHLPYTRMVIEESLRLYPPAWVITRRAIHDDELGGYHIPAGATVMFSPYAMHHNARYWDNPEGFDPERFTPERSAGRPAFAYFPFGGGPHLCIGNGFAMTEAQLILATVAQRYRLDLVPGHPVVPEPLVTLSTRYGLLVTLHPAED
jgi:cytochrome P450